MRFPFLVTGSILAIVSACAPGPPPRTPAPAVPPATNPARAPLSPTDRLEPAAPETVGMDSRLAETVDSIMRSAVAGGATPGAAVAVGRHGRLVISRGYGKTGSAPDAPPVTDSTLYDIASLTKVVATTTAAMLLEEEGKLVLDRTVASYLPELADPAKAGITVRMLLTHSGGLEAFAPLFTTLRGREAYLRAIDERSLHYPPGTRAVYSDWDMILLQLILERIAGQSLDALVEQRVFRPLAMLRTMFSPHRALHAETAPTQRDARRGLIHGEVHDPNAWAMGGVAGHAGLFSSARDLAVFAQMMLNGGTYAGVRILAPASIARWTAPQTAASSRALGWDTPSGVSSAGRHFSPRSFGHTGFTGTSLWIDPERGLFLILLTNRVLFGSENQLHIPLRRAVGDAVQAAVLDAPLVDWEARR